MSKLRVIHRNLILAATGAFVAGASSITCGGNSQAASGTGGGQSSGNTNGGSSGLGGSIGIDVVDMDYSAEQIYANDPPPMTCDGGGMPPPVGGTPQCPSDKNLPGCPCSPVGATATCWTGLRKDRNHGVCHDGMTTCIQSNEAFPVWGPCTGEQLPTGTTGKAACKCFSGGHWQIANLEPCFLTNLGTNMTVAYAATPGNPVTCPFDMGTVMPIVPASWSTDTLTVDCTGQFNLCYTIKAGNPMNPQPTDCILAKACASGYYKMANVVQMWPDLPGWQSDPSMAACVAQFMNTGGYGEMSVDGQSDECDLVNKVFQRVTYCPLSCNTNPDAGACQGCGNGAGGNF
jgi:hypothetical protein